MIAFAPLSREFIIVLPLFSMKKSITQYISLFNLCDQPG